MKVSKEQSKEISEAFDSMNDLSDLVSILNLVYKIGKKKSKNLFTVPRLNYLAYHYNKRYCSFKIFKRNGKPRKIKAPQSYLKIIQQCLNTILQSKFTAHHTAHGFLIDKSIVTNAKGHAGKNYVLNVDLKDFFDTINFRRVKTVLKLNPFNLNNEREKIAFLISNLCCDKGTLPQGAPTSPLITNIVCQRLDRKLFQLSKTTKTKYSRYADDITFSSQNEVFSEDFILEIRKIIESEGFKLNDSKTRVQNWMQRQEVTGLVVNERVNVTRERIKTIRAILNNYVHKGYNYTQKKFKSYWNNPNAEPPPFEISLKGQIEYLGMVRGKTDPMFLKYKTRYLENFSEHKIDYSFIRDERVRKQLFIDNQNMSFVFLNYHSSLREKFISYCVSAFLQIEEMINYFLSTHYSWEELKRELQEHTLLTNKSMKGRDDITMIAIIYKIFLFEKYFYYQTGTFYDSVITKLRIVRNNELHRQNSTLRSDETIRREYAQLMENIKVYRSLNSEGEYEMPYKDKHLEKEFKTVQFIEELNFTSVYDTLKDVAEKLKSN